MIFSSTKILSNLLGIRQREGLENVEFGTKYLFFRKLKKIGLYLNKNRISLYYLLSKW